LTLLRAVDAAETDAFSVWVVQDFDGVAVKDSDHRGDERIRRAERANRSVRRAAQR